jgi:hypothetical protein
MNFKFGIIFAIALMAVIFPVSAVTSGLASGWVPTWIPAISAYSFVTGLEDNNVTPYGGVMIDASQFTSEAKVRLGVTGMTLVAAKQYQDVDLQRGFAGIWYDSTMGTYYAVIQYSSIYDYLYSANSSITSNIITAFSGLQARYVGGNITYYYTGASATHFIAMPDKVFIVISHSGSGFTNFVYYKFGNRNLYEWYGYYSGSPGHDRYGTTGWEASSPYASGYIRSVAGIPLIAANISSNGSNYYTHTNSSVAGLTLNATMTALYGENTFLPEYRTLSGNVPSAGRVHFSAYEGASGSCGNQQNLPDVTCSIDSSSCTAAYNATSELIGVDTSPYFYPADVAEMPNGNEYFWVINKQGEITFSPRNDQDVATLMNRATNRSLWLHAWNAQGCVSNNWITQYTCGFQTAIFGGTNQLHTYGTAYQLRYTIPNIDNLDKLTSLTVNTTLYSTGGCKGFLQGGIQKWNITVIVGLNTTTYKKSQYTCDGGWGWGADAVAIPPVYGSNLNTLLAGTLMQTSIMAKAAQNPAWASPIFKDYEHNTLNRFFYYEQTFPNSAEVNERDFEFIDNENFHLTYNYTLYNPQTCSVNDVGYGLRSWQCLAPNATYQAVMASGTVNITSPLTSITAIFQRQRDLYLSINTLQNGQSIAGVQCAGSGTVVYSASQTGSQIYTCLWQVAANTIEPVIFSHLGQTASSLFPIGDYYNSQHYGIPEQNQTYCANFFNGDGTYHYWYDLANPNPSVIINVFDMYNQPITGASVKIDGFLVGGSDSAGIAKFTYPMDFIVHNVSASKVGYLTASVNKTVSELRSSVYVFRLAADTGSPFAPNTGGGTQTTEQLFGLISSKMFVSMLILLAALGSGATVGASAGSSLGGSLVAVAIVSAILTWIGFMPLAVLIPVGLALAVVGAYAISKLVSG